MLDLKHVKQGPEFREVGALEDLAALQEHLAWQMLRFLKPASAPSEVEFQQRHPAVRVDAADKPKKEKNPMEWKGSFCAVTEPAQTVAKTQEDWDALWKKIAADNNLYAGKDAAAKWLRENDPKFKGGLRTGASTWSTICWGV